MSAEFDPNSRLQSKTGICAYLGHISTATYDMWAQKGLVPGPVRGTFASPEPSLAWLLSVHGFEWHGRLRQGAGALARGAHLRQPRRALVVGASRAPAAF